MNKSELIDIICNREQLNEETLPDLQYLVENYPYFQTARLLLAKNHYIYNREAFEKNLTTTAAFCADRKKLFYLINNEKYAAFLPKVKTDTHIDRTQTLLDLYLTSFSESTEEISRNETHVVSTDYLSYLQSLENNDETENSTSTKSELKHQDIIDSFLEKAATNEISFTPNVQQESKPAEPETVPESSFLTETLAKIYIKQKKYEQALTIIQQLSLNFPEKSVYFADQIRFLELLILNEKNKKD